MENLNHLILVAAALLFASILASRLSSKFGFPLLLIFLAMGMLAGQDGPGGIAFEDFGAAFLVGQVALAIILLDGGLRTHGSAFRVAAAPAIVLASLGVLFTALLTALFVGLVLDLDWRIALLFGAMVGSTDAAAVFSLLGRAGKPLNDRVRSTLEVESGANDPLAIFLVILMIELIASDRPPGIGQVLGALINQFGVGALAGVAGGFLLSWLLNRLRLVEGLYALLVASGGLLLFAGANSLGGSGYLAIYLAGLVVGNIRSDATEHVLRVMDGLAWLAQSSMFLVLGLLATPSLMLETMAVAFAVAVYIILIARPVAVWLSLLPFHFPLRETAFVSWVGLRGAVPIVLALFPMLAGLEQARLLFDLTFAVVLVSLLIQGTTIGPVARLLRVQVPAPGGILDRYYLDLPVQPAQELAIHRIDAGCPAIDRPILEYLASLPDLKLHSLALLRDGEVSGVDTQTRARDQDVLLLLAPQNTQDRFAAHLMPMDSETRAFYGSLELLPNAPMALVADIYGADIPAEHQALTLGDLVRRELKHPLVAGDAVELGGLRLVVREAVNGYALRFGIRL
jgi:potassium/hydrogen antiporter